jgi:short-subunit dehydrogenase
VEAETDGIRVSALCPGYLRTAILEGGGKYGRIVQDVSPEMQKKLGDLTRPANVNAFAGKALQAIARNDAIIIYPWWYRIIWWLQRLSPAIGLFLSKKMLEETRKRIASTRPPD